MMQDASEFCVPLIPAANHAVQLRRFALGAAIADEPLGHNGADSAAWELRNGST
jgi:hypothetical protein